MGHDEYMMRQRAVVGENLGSKLRMLKVYTHSQKFDTIGISVIRDKAKICKKSIILKMSKTFLLIIMPKSYQQITKKNCPINKHK